MKESFKKCDGGCKKHIGKIEHVYSGKCPKTKEPWDWFYCQEAIKEDKSRGFKVRSYDSGRFL